MIQKRVNTGKSFELSVAKGDWKLLTDRPLIVWSGKGKNNIDKIKSLNLNHKNFIPTEKTKWSKSDVTNVRDGRKREIKKYNTKQIKSRNLYSEPFFKIARTNKAKRIGKIEYKNFTSAYNQSNNQK